MLPLETPEVLCLGCGWQVTESKGIHVPEAPGTMEALGAPGASEEEARKGPCRRQELPQMSVQEETGPGHLR